eukprot:4451326-Alexandrium_andersonii.AAC.1
MASFDRPITSSCTRWSNDCAKQPCDSKCAEDPRPAGRGCGPRLAKRNGRSSPGPETVDKRRSRPNQRAPLGGPCVARNPRGW